MRRTTASTTVDVALTAACAATAAAQTSLDRTTLPIPEPKYPPAKELDVRKATPPPRFDLKAPAQAPNILIVLIDDLGFAGTSTYGGPVGTPAFDRIANEGLYYNNSHTTAVFSPTRASSTLTRPSPSAPPASHRPWARRRSAWGRSTRRPSWIPRVPLWTAARTTRMLNNPILPRLLKKVQVQGGVQRAGHPPQVGPGVLPGTQRASKRAGHPA